MSKRLLILDDDENRHQKFREYAVGADRVHVYTARDAIDALVSLDRFDCVFLDHDLDVSASLGLAPKEDTGQTVATFIADHMDPRKWPRGVVIHSWNPAGARAMAAILSRTCIPTKLEPFK